MEKVNFPIVGKITSIIINRASRGHWFSVLLFIHSNKERTFLQDQDTHSDFFFSELHLLRDT